MPSYVWQANADFIDSDENRMSTLFCLKANTVEQAISAAQSYVAGLQSLSECRLIELFLTVAVGFSPTVNQNQGTVKRSLLCLCETGLELVTNRRYRFKVRIPSPDPGALNETGTELDPNSYIGGLFVSNFLSHITDVRGNLFATLIKSEVIQI